jgi:hypothetical protein
MPVRWVTTNVRIDPHDYADLQRMAAASGSSLAECIRVAVGRYLGHPEQGGAAGEALGAYAGAGTGEPAGGATPEAGPVAAVVHGRTLLLQEPLGGFREGQPVWVRVVGAAEIMERERHRRVVAELLAEFERTPPGPPAPTGEDDRELYR